MKEKAAGLKRDEKTGRYTRAQTDETQNASERRALGYDTRLQSGHGESRQHGVHAFTRRGDEALPSDIREALEQFRTGLVRDQGGSGELTTIAGGYLRRLSEVEGICQLLAGDLEARGLLTQRGRVRSTFTAFLNAIDRWDRLAQRLGMARRARPVTLDQWAGTASQSTSDATPALHPATGSPSRPLRAFPSSQHDHHQEDGNGCGLESGGVVEDSLYGEVSCLNQEKS